MITSIFAALNLMEKQRDRVSAIDVEGMHTQNESKEGELTPPKAKHS